MSKTREDLIALAKKRSTYMSTAAKVYEENADKDGKFKDKAKEEDFVGLLNKIGDVSEAIHVMAKEVVPEEDWKSSSMQVYGYESLLTAIEAEKTAVNEPVQPVKSGFSDSKTRPFIRVEEKAYKNMFGGSSNDGFKSFDEYLSVICSKRFDPRLRNAATEGVPAEGGFIVPTEYAGMLLDKSLESEIVRPRATVWTMKTDTRKVPAWDSANHSAGNTAGGLKGVWLAEGGTATRQTPKLRIIELTAKKLACFSQGSNELLADGMDFEAQLSSAMIGACGWSMDYAFFNGTGAGQPLGMLADPALITVAKESGQAARTVLYDNIVKMFARIAPQCLANSVWMVNNSVIPQLLMLSMVVGTGGSHVPVMNESNGKFTILTRPVIFTEKVPALGSVGDISLVDWSQYCIGMRKEVALDRSNAPGWTEDLTDYRTILRVDGQGTWDQAITPKHGDSLSWCVTLAARA